MDEYQGSERRKSPRKRIYLPIKLIAKDTIVSLGQMLNISCYGIKLEIMFMSNEERALIEKILSIHNITLEIGEVGDRLYIKIPVDVRWSAHNYDEGENVFEAGMDLQLNEEHKEEWQQFYDAL